MDGPGLAVAYATAPEAEAIRSELSRTLLDLLRAGRAARLLAARDLIGRAGALAALLAPAPAPAAAVAPARGRGRGSRAAARSRRRADPAAATAAGDAPADAA